MFCDTCRCETLPDPRGFCLWCCQPGAEARATIASKREATQARRKANQATQKRTWRARREARLGLAG